MMFRETVSRKPFCGGSILDERHIITAAHCCKSKRYGVLRNDSPLIIGEHDLSYNSGNERRYYPKLVHIHPMYNQDAFKYDICIIETECMQLNNPRSRAPVCLPTINDHLKGRHQVMRMHSFLAIQRYTLIITCKGTGSTRKYSPASLPDGASLRSNLLGHNIPTN